MPGALIGTRRAEAAKQTGSAISPGNPRRIPVKFFKALLIAWEGVWNLREARISLKLMIALLLYSPLIIKGFQDPLKSWPGWNTPPPYNLRFPDFAATSQIRDFYILWRQALDTPRNLCHEGLSKNLRFLMQDLENVAESNRM